MRHTTRKKTRQNRERKKSPAWNVGEANHQN